MFTVPIIIQDAALTKAVETVDSAKGYLMAAKDSTVDQVVGEQDP